MAKKSTLASTLTRSALQGTLAGLERVRPEWAAHLAERLWFFVGRPPAPSVRNRHPVPSGTPFALTLRRSAIRGLRWGDLGAPLAYLIHGWGGWWQQMSAFVPVLLAHGYQVVAFDAPAHGDSGPGAAGRRSGSVPEMAAAYEAVAERFGAPAATVAHSMGCVSVVWAQRYHGIAPDRQVLIAPAANSQGWLDIFTRTVRMGPRSRQLFDHRLDVRIGRPLSDFDLLPLVAAEQADRHLPPALIMHDRGDRMTSPAESEALAAQWPNSDLVITEGHGHYRILRAPEVLTAVGEFLG